ncbi:CAP-Gly domain-containing linker protein 4, partial [Stegodyphus mimosarum]
MDGSRVEEMTIGEECISTSNDEDKKFVSQAVAFVIGHGRNGFVPLCASVATLLKEQARLKQENESLYQQLTLLRSKLLAEQSDISTENRLIESSSKFSAPSSVEDIIISENTSSYDINKIKYSTKNDQKTTSIILKGCLCMNCSKAPGGSRMFKTPLKKGDKVVILGELCGTVQYVGHIDSQGFSEVFVGLYLDEAVGDSNGSIGGKTYFSVPERYGLFVPLSYVCCQMS